MSWHVASCHINSCHGASCHVISRHAIWLRGADLWAGHSVSAFCVFLCDDLIQQTRVEIHKGVHKMHVGGIDEELALVTEKSWKIEGRSCWVKNVLSSQPRWIYIIIHMSNNKWNFQNRQFATLETGGNLGRGLCWLRTYWGHCSFSSHKPLRDCIAPVFFSFL